MARQQGSDLQSGRTLAPIQWLERKRPGGVVQVVGSDAHLGFDVAAEAGPET